MPSPPEPRLELEPSDPEDDPRVDEPLPPSAGLFAPIALVPRLDKLPPFELGLLNADPVEPRFELDPDDE